MPRVPVALLHSGLSACRSNPQRLEPAVLSTRVTFAHEQVSFHDNQHAVTVATGAVLLPGTGALSNSWS
jgi:hypothetical protein